MPCRHENLEIIKLTSGPHWGKEICSDCGAYRRFVSNPEGRKYKDRCADLLQLCEPLDINFVRSVAKQFKTKGLSEKQYAALKRIVEENFGEKIKELKL